MPLVKPGDDLAQLIVNALSSENLQFRDGDVVVVSQKIVSKAEGLLVDISKLGVSKTARRLAKRTEKDQRLVSLILRDTLKVLRADGDSLVVRRKDGFVCLNAGVDKSNVSGSSVYSRLPPDPDSSARNLRAGLERISGRKLVVIIADSYSRPFRKGQVEFAIGISGLEPLVDYRGARDLFGYRLKYKVVGLVDEVAAAAELVMGQGTEGIPVALIRGLLRMKISESRSPSKKLVLDRKSDLFSGVL